MKAVKLHLIVESCRLTIMPNKTKILKVNILDVFVTAKMGKHKPQDNFGSNQIMMARRLGKSISKTAGLFFSVFSFCIGQYLPRVV